MIEPVFGVAQENQNQNLARCKTINSEEVARLDIHDLAKQPGQSHPCDWRSTACGMPRESPASLTRNSYNAIDKLIASVDALGRITQYEYDNTGRQTKVIYPDGAFEQTEYDFEGNEIAKTDRAGRTTRMQYDAANRLVKTIYPDDTPSNALDNPFTESVYDAAGQLKISRNERGHETHYDYDNAGRQTTITDALGKTTTHQYDLTGRRLSTTDALGRVIKFEYDLAGKLIATIYPDATSDDGNDANNPRTQIAYDAVGRKQSETDEMGRKTEFKYDSLGRLTEVWLAAHTASPIKTKYSYDEQGNKLTQTDALNRVTAWAYDKNGRNVERKLPLGQVESFDYNAAGERIKHTTFNNAVMNYAYDNLGRIDTITFPDNTTRKFTYNTAGQVASINDKGAVYAFSYDARDRLIQATDSNNRKIDYGYDIAGNRVELKTPSSTIGYEYDELNRLSKVIANLVGQAANQTTQYAYDDVGNRVGQINPNKSTVSYSYDRRNRLSNLAHKTASGVMMLGMAYTVDASGLRTNITEQRSLNNVLTTTRTAAYTYDAMKRLTQSTVVAPTTVGGNLSEVFSYDNVGNRLTRNCVATIKTCTGGLSTSASIGTVSTTYTYDNNDRLLREVWGVNFGATYDFAYDNAGNLLNKKQNTNTLASYSWDAENRLTQAVMTPAGTSGNTTTTNYSYDPNGIRRSAQVVAKVVGAAPSVTKTVTNFLIDPNQSYAQVLEDWTAKATIAGSTEPTTMPDASLQNSYVYGDDLIAELRYAAMPNATGAGSVAVGDGGNDPLARIGALSGESVYHYDGLGSTRLLSALNLDAAGNPVTTGTAQNPSNETVTDSYAYTAFGETDIASTTGTTENNYRFTGEQLDPNLGWYYLRARYMNPTQGRFVGMDSWMGNSADPVTLHKYLYANANSVMYTDPSGFVGLIELGSAQNILSTMVMTAVRSYAFDAISNVLAKTLLGNFANNINVPKTGNVSGAGLVSALAIMCKANKKRCLLRGIPTYISGLETPYSTAHIVFALSGNGTTSDEVPQPLPFILVKGTGRDDVDPRRGKPGCAGAGIGFVCDEYPYASTLQGGNLNYRAGRVSLQWAPYAEGSIQGNYLKKFYRVAGIVPASPMGIFLNVGIPFFPTSFIDRDGDWRKL